DVLAAAALASLAVSQGHAGFDPAQPQRLVDAALPWPAPEQWSAQLAASRWVSTAVDNSVESEQSPLVWENGLLYLRRYREYERRLALGLQRIGQVKPETRDVSALAQVFGRLFEGEAPSPQPSPASGRGGSFRTESQMDAEFQSHAEIQLS